MSTQPPQPQRGSSQPAVRASDAEREHVAELLQMHFTEGRIDAEELQERLETTYNARTRAELMQVLDDLPMSRAPLPGLRGATGRPGGSGSRAPYSFPRLIAIAFFFMIALSIIGHHAVSHLWSIGIILIVCLVLLSRTMRRNG